MPRLFIYGFPGLYGGAGTELHHQIPIWLALGISVHIIPIQQGWFITNLTYGDFVLNGVRIVVSPNILNQFRNKIPFGLCCLSVGNREPSLQKDFLSNACNLYLVTDEETNKYAEILTLGRPS